MKRWIEHISEPVKLILSWQAPLAQEDRTRWIVGEVLRDGSGAMFRYFPRDEFKALNKGRDYDRLCSAGFIGYPAFKFDKEAPGEFRDQVLQAFVRRVPPRARPDFQRYLEHFRIEAGTTLSDFALLGATEAKLPGDGFSLIDPLDPSSMFCEAVVEIAGFRHNEGVNRPLTGGIELSLVPEPTNEFDRYAVRLELDGLLLGYINRVQSRTVSQWVAQQRTRAWFLRLNGTLERPRAYALLEVRPQHLSAAA